MPCHAGRPLLFLSLVVGAGFAVAAPPARAGGWQEMHESADDVRVSVGSDGVASIEHHLRFRVVAGRFKAFELAGVDPRAEIVPETVVLPEKGAEIEARVEASPKLPGTVRVVWDEPKKGVGRGVYLMGVKYKLDLVAAKMLVRDGAMWRLSWTAPPATEGRDGARVVFDLPSAPTEPRLAAPEQATTTLATLRRQPERDELELVRTHVPRGEAVVWSARVDPKAFPKIATPELRPPRASGADGAGGAAVAAAPAEANHARAAALATALAALAGILAFVLRAKQAAVAEACEASGARARPLVPLPHGLAPFAYGAASTGALAVLLVGTPAYGALLVAVAMALAAHRAPALALRARGPGRWRAARDAEVLVPHAPAPATGDALDIGTTRGRLAALGVAALVACAAFVLRSRIPGAAVAIPLGAAVLAPVFATGTRAQLPKKPEELAARFLRPVRDALGALVDLAHVDLRAIARVREGAAGAGAIDEVRLACAPAEPIPGLRAIELALASSALGAVPEVLVRYDDASEAAAKIAALAPGVAVVPGRAPEERVLRLAPITPTARGAARLVSRLLEALEGRRAADRALLPLPYAGPERRTRFTSVRAAAAT